ncbi:hypothetical protein H4J02_01415 [Protaetiibacter sp. SSC-01]|uniref:hypothetical protein n=1 Tax=Protaetiibacter sp. SSC-01 TaxID=2759943 RepID=UPI001656D3BF|nr:hypothetical protein [Protaetiibacter sp. SSC-01]QNO37731.1 hypothetical protein H4J02_01415 [Protaetiibacter sp. SSC-01]
MPIMIASSFDVQGDGDLDAQTDVIMDELIEVEETTSLIFDSSVSAALADRTVEISFAVNVDDPADAQAIAKQILEQVIRAAGGNPQVATADASDVFQWSRSEQSVLVSV